jgi:hypothetical protein
MSTHIEMPTQHTFLVAAGDWEARGSGRVGADGREARITGFTQVRPDGAGNFRVQSTMIVHAQFTFEVKQTYEIHETSTQNRFHFVSHNDRVGEMTGEIWLLPNYIVLHSASTKGRFRGSEVLFRRTTEHYTAIGQFLADRRAQSVWEVQLRRVSAEGAGIGG